jgi:hypothetical protein
MKNIFFVIMVCLLMACSIHQVKTASSNQIKDFGQDIKVIVAGEDFDISNQLSRHIQAMQH